MSKDAPHCLQNFEPDRFPRLHIGQCISPEVLSSAVFSAIVSPKEDAPELYGTLATDSPLGSNPYLLGPTSPCLTNQIIHQMNINKDIITIKGEKAHHLQKVARVKVGESILILDGNGYTVKALCQTYD